MKMRRSEFVNQRKKKSVKLFQIKVILSIFMIQIAIVIFTFKMEMEMVVVNFVLVVDMKYQLRQICKNTVISIFLLVETQINLQFPIWRYMG